MSSASSASSDFGELLLRPLDAAQRQLLACLGLCSFLQLGSGDGAVGPDDVLQHILRAADGGSRRGTPAVLVHAIHLGGLPLVSDLLHPENSSRAALLVLIAKVLSLPATAFCVNHPPPLRPKVHLTASVHMFFS